MLVRCYCCDSDYDPALLERLYEYVSNAGEYDVNFDVETVSASSPADMIFLTDLYINMCASEECVHVRERKCLKCEGLKRKKNTASALSGVMLNFVCSFYF